VESPAEQVLQLLDNLLRGAPAPSPAELLSLRHTIMAAGQDLMAPLREQVSSWLFPEQKEEEEETIICM
jgi:hypothetical protein